MQLEAYKSVMYSPQTAPQICFPHAIPAIQTSRPLPRRVAKTQCSMRRQQHPGAQALSASDFLENNVNSDAGSRHERLLVTLTGYSISQLRQHVHEHPDDVSLSFLQWLASREEQLQGDAKLRLAVLAGQLLALREGLDPSGFDDVADELQMQWQESLHLGLPDQQQHQSSGTQQQQTPNQSQPQSSNEARVREPSATEQMNSVVFPATPSSLEQSLVVRGAECAAALNAFSQASIVRQYKQVQLLNLDVRQAHAQSTVQLIGRKQISASDPPQMEGAAQRILDHLLGLPTAELRREVLPEAFQPPECGVAEEEYGSLSGRDEATTEQLSTSPLQLLQAVDLELARIRNQSSTGAEDSKMMLPAGDFSTGKMHDALQQLRADVLAHWDAS
ncbi:hypothetical protein ABBQ32_005618 [Trebouxia sp. C0010 RCD-2024]